MFNQCLDFFGVRPLNDVTRPRAAGLETLRLNAWAQIQMNVRHIRRGPTPIKRRNANGGPMETLWLAVGISQPLRAYILEPLVGLHHLAAIELLVCLEHGGFQVRLENARLLSLLGFPANLHHLVEQEEGKSELFCSDANGSKRKRKEETLTQFENKLITHTNRCQQRSSPSLSDLV